MRTNSKIVPSCVAGVLVAALAWFVWPTPYQYFKSGSVNERSNRVTGRVQVLTPAGWQTNISTDIEPLVLPASKEFTGSDLVAIQSNSTINVDSGSITLWIHNPTSETIVGATVRLILLHKQPQLPLNSSAAVPPNDPLVDKLIQQHAASIGLRPTYVTQPSTSKAHSVAMQLRRKAAYYNLVSDPNFKNDTEAQSVAHKYRVRGFVTDPTQGGLDNNATSANNTQSYIDNMQGAIKLFKAAGSPSDSRANLTHVLQANYDKLNQSGFFASGDGKKLGNILRSKWGVSDPSQRGLCPRARNRPRAVFVDHRLLT